MKKKILLSVLFTFLFLSAGISLWQLYLHYYHISYEANASTASSELLDNPYQGWYHIYGYLLSDDLPDMELLEKQIEEAEDTNLVMLQLNLMRYSDQAISAEALHVADQLFTIWGNAGKQLIVRFLYDWDGNALLTEPDSIDVIKNHIQQTASIINKHADSIYILQGIYVGAYGEMHSSKFMSEADMCLLADALDAAIDPSIFLAVRTPTQWRTINHTTDPITAADAYQDTKAARISLFNDGMMGSESDLGTYAEGSRADELLFQSKLCQYVPNGGEVVYDTSYNDLSNAIQTLETMHISYLDIDYDLSVIQKWQDTVYHGNDCFDGESGLDYITAHLGYRFELVSSDCSYRRLDDTLTLQLSVKNSGFASCYRPLDAIILLQDTDTGAKYVLPVDTDSRYWPAGATVTLAVPVSLKSCGTGQFRVFFTLTDPAASDQLIQMATTLKQTEDGYCIGMLEIKKFL